MDFIELGKAAILGLLEGATEFLPVSSTGHLILAGHWLGFEAKDNVFEIVIQTGAILAIILLYFGKLWSTLIGLPRSPQARSFALAVIAAFLPAAILGAIFHEVIKTVLFSPLTVSWALIIGGLVLIWVDKMKLTFTVTHIDQITPKIAFRIGMAQCFAIIPGVSRSGATMVGAMLTGVDRKTAAEFSFFLAIPTLIGASAFDLSKSYGALLAKDYVLIAVGFACAFLSALLVIRGFIAWLSSHGLAIFGWYRIALGFIMLLMLHELG
jgi:undecaprenyl-diphosphatase